MSNLRENKYHLKKINYISNINRPRINARKIKKNEN